jgi:hypothetical protein
VGETRVDLLHLLEDIRDAYPGALEETILTEVLANALDSGAGRIAITPDPAAATLTVVDDGAGMRRRELARYHDVAASTKTRGQGIGFAGVGIKLGLLVADEVRTETRRGKSHVASSWHLASRHRAPWRWVPPAGLVDGRGTAVRLHVRNSLSPLLDAGFIETTVRRHFEPLLDPQFAPLLADHYPRGVRIEVAGRALGAEPFDMTESAPIGVRVGRQRKLSASGYLCRAAAPLPEHRRGLGISTLGKVIRCGWDWLGLSPADPDRIGGLIEVPALAESLTLNKADFVRTGPRGATYLTYRKAIQEAVARQLAAWGDARDTAEEAQRRATRPLAREVERVVAELADAFPLLASLVEPRPGAQGRLPISGRAAAGAGAHAFVATSVLAAAEARPEEPPRANGGESVARERPQPPVEAARTDGASPERTPARYGLDLRFEARPDDPEPGRLVESTIWVNTAHPAHRRAAASRAEGYHVAVVAALALARVAVEPSEEHAFLNAFLTRWGEAVEGRRRRTGSGRAGGQG